MFPLNNDEGKRGNPQREDDFNSYERFRVRLLKQLNLAKLPDTLDEYLTRFVVPALERQKRDGAVAVKFTAAYVRSLDFADVPEEEARRIYAKGLW